MSLPSGAIRLNWIQSTGTQYVDTGILGKSGLSAKSTFVVNSTGECMLLGCYGGARCYLLYFDSLQMFYGYLNSYPSGKFAITAGQKYSAEVSLAVGNQSIKIDGVTKVSSALTESYTTVQNLYLFAFNNSGSPSLYASARLYDLQIYDNGLLVRDYIPCKMSDGSVGLWDDVEGKFYGNAGTGTFVAGPAAEIAELEYIESTGTEYLDTGFIPNQDTRVVVDFELVSPPLTYSVPFGVEDSSTQRFWVYVASPSVIAANWQALYGSKETKCTPTGDGRQTVDFGKTGFLTKGVHTDLAAYTFKCDRSIWLCCVHYRGDTARYLTKAKYYSCQIYDNGLLVRDYVPAKTIEGEIGLYDRVFKEFYRNAGTGEFIAGPEMVHEDYTELEYVESNGTQYTNTGFNPTGNTRVVMDFDLMTGSAGWPTLFGAWTGSGNAMFGVMQVKSTAKTLFAYNTANTTLSVNISGRHLVEVDKGQFLVDGTEIESRATASFTASNPLILFDFGGVETSGTNRAVGKLYSCKIYDNGTAVRIYIPKMHPSGVAGLWDSVNERFYASETTTDFIAGPENVKAPKAPGNFRVVSESDTEVALAWDASENAAGYRLYRNGGLLADTTELTYTDPAEPFGAYTYTVRAYNELGESDAAELVVIVSPDNPILWLVTDRTAQDVSERNSKGVCRAQDLNRVGAAVDFLKGLLESAGHTVNVFPRADWSALDWMNTEEAARYLADVSEIRRKLTVPASTPKTPESMERLTFTKANHIEQILLDVYTQYLIMLTTRVAAGTATSGGDYL